VFSWITWCLNVYYNSTLAGIEAPNISSLVQKRFVSGEETAVSIARGRMRNGVHVGWMTHGMTEKHFVSETCFEKSVSS
jgi:hypothetical protein